MRWKSCFLKCRREDPFKASFSTFGNQGRLMDQVEKQSKMELGPLLLYLSSAVRAGTGKKFSGNEQFRVSYFGLVSGS